MAGTLLDLIDQPLVNNLKLSAHEALHAKRYPLRAVYQDDLTIHLDTEVPPSELYGEYLYRSGVSQPYIDHCKGMYHSLNHLNLETIIDIGGNDGTLLKTFRNEARIEQWWSGKGPRRLINVDASESFKQVNEDAGIEYHCGFFNEHMDLPKANLIVSTNVFQHTKDIHSFLRGIAKHLDGVWVLEFPYTLTTLLTLQFDQFYHEHYYYWLITPLAKLFSEYGLRIVHIKETSIHGGSMRMWMTNKDISAPSIDDVIEKYKDKESLIDLETFDTNCRNLILKSWDFLSSLQGRTAFFGAAAKGAVFLNALSLSTQNMQSYVVDDTPGKQGKYIPGTGFEIVDRQRLKEDPVDNIVILAHNFADYIAKSLRKEFTGNIYTCLPSITKF